MNRRTLLAAALAAGASGCGVIGGHTVRYRLAVRAFVDGREHEGASVNQVQWAPNLIRDPAHPEDFVPTYWAEAPVIDLGPRGLLFALLMAPYGYHTESMFNVHRPHAYLLQRLPRDLRRDTPIGDRYAALNDLEGEFPLRPQEQPVLVRFRDIADPASVELVEPEDFARVYGAGARFMSGGVAITRAPMTRTILGVLPWLRAVPAPAGHNIIGGDGYRGPTAASLTRRHFQIDGFRP